MDLLLTSINEGSNNGGEPSFQESIHDMSVHSWTYPFLTPLVKMMKAMMAAEAAAVADVALAATVAAAAAVVVLVNDNPTNTDVKTTIPIQKKTSLMHFLISILSSVDLTIWSLNSSRIGGQWP